MLSNEARLPTVSVIIPVYNVEQYIAETIESVLGQTFEDFEIVIVDDGATDSSVEICRRIEDRRIRLIHQHNRGLAGARNTGIRHARGQYLAFLDSDDLWHAEKLARHVEHLQQSPQVGVSFSRSTFIDENGQPLGIHQMPKLTDITPGYLFCRNPISNGSTPVIRRGVFDAIKFQANLYGTVEDFYFDDSFRQSEDIECWLRIALQTDWSIEGIPESLTLYRVNSGGLSANLMKQYAAWERIVDRTRTYAPEFLAEWESRARAYQLRYLARRAVSQQDGRLARQLVQQSLVTDGRILLTEPRRTGITLIAAYLLALLPQHRYRQLERWMMRSTGRQQRRAIVQQSGNPVASS
ncbi:MAG: glycosyltransferase family 2 protein [Cyanobacteria bacterium J06627_15]